MRKDTRYRPGNRARKRPCLLCKKVMRQDHIKRHVQETHLGIKPPKIQCTTCFKSYTRQGLKGHRCYLGNKPNKAEKPIPDDDLVR